MRALDFRSSSGPWERWEPSAAVEHTEVKVPGAELLQQDVDDVSEGGGYRGLLTQQGEQGLEGGEGRAGVAGVAGRLQVLVTRQQQCGNGIPFQHLHTNPPIATS